MSRYRLNPAAQRVAIKPWPDTEKTAGGLYIPPSASSDKPIIGEVVAVCDEYFDGPTHMHPLFTVGDIVVIGRWTGTEIRIDRDSYILLYEKDVLAVLEPNLEVAKDEGDLAQCKGCGKPIYWERGDRPGECPHCGRALE